MKIIGELDYLNSEHLQESRARLSNEVVGAAAMKQHARRLRISSSMSPDDDENEDDEDSDDVFKKRKQIRKYKFLKRKPSATRVDFQNDEEAVIDETDESSVRLEDEDSDQDFEERKESRKGKFLEHKKSATRVDFQSNDEEVIMEEWDGGDWEAAPQIPRGMAKPTGKKSRKSQQKKYEGRRMWTETEIYAIKEGIASFGWGKWAEIKDHYNAILKNRTSSQIKVRYLRID
jgi:hypothetical protein